MTKHPILIAGALLAMFTGAGTGLVALTHEHTAERIAANERLALLGSFAVLVPPASVDNDMATDLILVHRPDRLGAETTRVYRGRLQGEPVAAILDPIVPDGYAGPIKLLVAVRRDGTLGGVRVISHKETPGLGDRIDEAKSGWLYSFNDKSLSNPALEAWKVKKDGGVFDQFTGATITPRSIVKAVKNTLLYVQEQGDNLFVAATQVAEASNQ